MNPDIIKQDINEALRSEMKRLRPLGQTYPDDFQKPLDKMLQSFEFAQESYLEGIPYYEPDEQMTLAKLCAGDNPVLEPETAKAFTRYFGCNDPGEVMLYTHQVNSLKAAHDGKNLIVCTGTGSGKTESFLLPLINGIVRERKERGDQYQPGIRALILYPMNALVNDQLRRLRSVIGKSAMKKGVADDSIPYVRDITFGRFTGDVQTDLVERKEEEKLRCPFSKELAKICQEVTISKYCDHPSFFSDVIIDNEYTRRSEWYNENSAQDVLKRGRGPADILITNYVMLERMLLNPNYDFMFSETWKYIVLDEAHCYDGALGTDIAWLLRRLSHRVSASGMNKMTYIATSATLVEDGDDKEERIRREFASKLFPADAASFDVQLGSLYTRSFSSPKNDCESVDYTQIASTQFFQIYEEPAFKNVPIRMQERARACEGSLMKLTKWLFAVKEWCQSTSYFKIGFTEKYSDYASAMAFGDALELLREAESVESLSGKHDQQTRECLSFAFSETPSWQRIREILKRLLGQDTDEECADPEKVDGVWHEAIENAVGACNRSQFREIQDLLTNYLNERESSIPSCYALIIPAILNQYLEKQEFAGNSSEIEDVARWEVAFDSSTARKLTALREVVVQTEHACCQLEELMAKEWRSVMGVVNASACIREAITEFLLRYSHVGHLSKLLVDAKPSERARRNLIRALFGDSEKGEPQFSSLTDLITLSKHPVLKGKTLLDLRYHQAVSTIGSVAISYNEEDQVVLYANDGRVINEKDQRLFDLEICNYCAAPYIVVYTLVSEKKTQKDKITCKRFKTGEYTCKTRLLCWKPHADYEGAASVHDVPSLYLNFDTGELVAGLEKNCLPVYALVEEESNSNKGNEKEQITITCPVCGNRTYNGAHPISAYKTGSDLAKFVLITELVKHCDPDPCPSSKAQSEGRRILAFSDSRQGAARLAANYELFEKDSLVFGGLAASYQEMQCKNPSVIYDEVSAFYETYKSDTGKTFMPEEYASADKMVCNIPDEYNEQKTMIMECPKYKEKRQVDAAKCHLSLHAYVPYMYKHILKTGATSLLRFEYRDYVDVKPFSLPSSLTLFILGSLRKEHRSALVRSGRVRLRSYRYEKLKEERNKLYCNFLTYFDSPEKADTYFYKVYHRLFINSALCVDKYDSVEGHCYAEECTYVPDEKEEGDVPRAMNGYSLRPKKKVSRMPNDKSSDYEKIAAVSRGFYVTRYKLIQSNSDQKKLGCIEALCAILFPKISDKDTILDHSLRGKFNLLDVRIEVPKERNKESWIHQYYRIEEHTAQLSNLRGQLYQRQFMDGQINILSCSTTFEMGIDLGNLNCVFLANLPPEASNYKQRAGRAGRRSGTVSYVLTYLGDKPHDSHFREHPYDLFFGKIKQPSIYLNNLSFRAKHLRAEALHSLLSYLAKNKLNLKHSDMLNEELFDSKVDAILGSWYAERGDAIQESCEKLAQSELDYKVALDLLYQTYGFEYDEQNPIREWMKDQPFAKIETFREFAGPHHPEENSYWHASAKMRYLADNSSLSSKKQSIYTSLPNWGVLPRYGFPCNVIELQSRDRNGLRLRRDAKTGIFEYMEGQWVLADKHAYLSGGVLFLSSGRKQHQWVHDMHVWLCDSCLSSRVVAKGNDGNRSARNKQCDVCGGRLTLYKFCIPDAFVVKGLGKKVNSNFYGNYVDPIITCLNTEEKLDFTAVEGTNIGTAVSETGELLYINETKCHEEDSLKKFDGAVHRIRTEIVSWGAMQASEQPLFGAPPPKSGNPQVVRNIRIYNAYVSALQAILKASSQVLGMNQSDIQGMIHQVYGMKTESEPEYVQGLRIMLFDNSANGSGTIMRLFVSHKQTDEQNHHASLLSKEILKLALHMCSSCKCSQVDMRCWPLSEGDVIQRRSDGDLSTRYRKACYQCIRGYQNQRCQDVLDAADAVTILRFLLGEK